MRSARLGLAALAVSAALVGGSASASVAAPAAPASAPASAGQQVGWPDGTDPSVGWPDADIVIPPIPFPTFTVVGPFASYNLCQAARAKDVRARTWCFPKVSVPVTLPLRWYYVRA